MVAVFFSALPSLLALAEDVTVSLAGRFTPLAALLLPAGGLHPILGMFLEPGGRPIFFRSGVPSPLLGVDYNKT